MCLSSAYEVANGAEKLICDRVTNVSIEGKNVVLTNLLGMQTVVAGEIRSIDLNSNIIRIETEKQ